MPSDYVGVLMAGFLLGPCPTLAIFSEHQGQHIFYNCFLELKMATRMQECEVGKCIGSAHLFDKQSGRSLTINVAGSKCTMEPMRDGATSFQAELAGNSVSIDEHLGFSVGSDGRLISAYGYRKQDIDRSTREDRVVCRGQNPVRRNWERAR